MTRPLAAAAADAIEGLEALDPPANAIAGKVRQVIPDGVVKNTLSGAQIGHALHPLLTDLPIGTWTSSTLLDLVGGEDAEGASDRLIGIGLLSAVGTVVTGWSDWADAQGDAGVRRSGLVHAALNAAATSCMIASLVARRQDDRGRGKLLSLAGMGLLGAGGWLGGHLSYAQGMGVDQTVFDPGKQEWTAVSDLDAGDLREGTPVCAVAGETPVMLVRRDGAIRALHNRCSHRGGPLADGVVESDRVTCPWHGTAFSLEDGSVLDGPAAYPQPVFDAREADGRIEVRRRSH